MTVNRVKSLAAKLFKTELILIRMTYSIDGSDEYLMDDDIRQLSFYSVGDGGEIKVFEDEEQVLIWTDR
jgi:hypothetical protein